VEWNVSAKGSEFVKLGDLEARTCCNTKMMMPSATVITFKIPAQVLATAPVISSGHLKLMNNSQLYSRISIAVDMPNIRVAQSSAAWTGPASDPPSSKKEVEVEILNENKATAAKH
jgi:hypothetical protein